MIEYLPIVLTGIGIIVSILYYTSVLRSQNLTREAQLLNSIYQDLNSKERWMQLADTMNMEWTDFSDFKNKYSRDADPDAYGTWMSILWTLGGIGHLLQEGMIEAKKTYNLVGPFTVILWDKFESVIIEYRKEWNMPEGYVTFEYLGNEMKKLRDLGYQTEIIDKYRKNSQN